MLEHVSIKHKQQQVIYSLVQFLCVTQAFTMCLTLNLAFQSYPRSDIVVQVGSPYFSIKV